MKVFKAWPGAVVGGMLSCYALIAWADAPREQEPALRTYAMVASVGDQLSIVGEVRSTGSRLSPYRRSTLRVSNDLLNRLALAAMDQAIEKAEPESRRLSFVLPGAGIGRLPPDQREVAAIAQVISQLRGHPDRVNWARIVVVTPAYRGADIDGLATRLQGLGLFLQPVRGGIYASPDGDVDLDAQAGTRVRAPSGLSFRSQAYVAPFVFVELWVLDAVSLDVLSRHSEFRNLKLGDPMALPRDVFQGLDNKALSTELGGLLMTAIGQAVSSSAPALKQGSITVNLISPDSVATPRAP